MHACAALRLYVIWALAQGLSTNGVSFIWARRFTGQSLQCITRKFGPSHDSSSECTTYDVFQMWHFLRVFKTCVHYQSSTTISLLHESKLPNRRDCYVVHPFLISSVARHSPVCLSYPSLLPTLHVEPPAQVKKPMINHGRGQRHKLRLSLKQSS